MKTSISGIKFIKSWEGVLLKSYKCPAGVWTIGYGSTYYENGNKVKEGETITLDRAEKLLLFEVGKIEAEINSMGLNLNQPQFDAIVSFCFNVGMGAFKRSTLLKKIKKQPGAVDIRTEFLKWNKIRTAAGLVISKGLSRRRVAEGNLYFG